MKLPLFSLTAKASTVTVSDAVFAAPVNKALLAQAVRVYRSNQRQGSVKVKTRGEVKLTTKKMYKQKGTGNARHGAASAPIFVGGGRAHGPTGHENWNRSLTPVMARRALVSAFSALAQDKKIAVVADLEQLEGKTKPAGQFISTVRESEAKRVLVVIDDAHPNIVKALRNLENVKITRASRVNSLEAVSAHQILIMKPALAVLESRLITEKEQA